MKNLVFIGLGTNLGNREQHLHDALDLIGTRIGDVINVSHPYENKAWGYVSDARYLNSVAEIKTDMQPQELLDALKKIEHDMGRKPKKGITYEDRPIDLDILFFNNETIENERLTIPHKTLEDRDFVLIPMAEIAPDFVHPIIGENISSLLDRFQEKQRLSTLLPTIKNIVFDLGGVLIDLNTPRCLEKFAQLGLKNPAQYISSTHTTDLFEQLERGNITIGDFCDGIRKIIGDETLPNQAIEGAWMSILESVPDEKLEMLLRLRKTHRVFLLSNTNVLHFGWIRKTQFEKNGHCTNDYFDHCFVSHEMHTVKPYATIFEQMMNAENMLPNETLFIDDSARNIEAAKHLGILTYFAHPQECFNTLFP